MAMNIFTLDQCPITSAKALCDKHVVKMTLESAQILCTVASKQGHPTPYKPTHAHHPCTIWAGASLANWIWLMRHAVALCQEYYYRYSKRHKSTDVILELATTPLQFESNAPTPFAQAIPDTYRVEDPIIAYRAYYLAEKSRFAKWDKGRNPPYWWRY